MSDALKIVGAIVAIAAVTALIQWRFHPLYSIPTIGPSLPLLSYIGAYRYYKNAREVLQDGYAKHKIFKVAMLDQWIVVVSGAEMNEKLRQVPASHATFHKAAVDLFETQYSLSKNVIDHPIHIAAIRGPLTKNLTVKYDDIVDEIQAAFTSTIESNLQDDEWTSVNVLTTMAVIISRATSRVFVGLPLCRDEDYLRIIRQFAFDVTEACCLLSWVPTSLKPVVGQLIPWARKATRDASTYLRPMIEERQGKLREMGEGWAGKPNDCLMWIMDEAQRQGESAQVIIDAMMASNFAAIHTSSNSITHALYHLAESPQYAEMLREEVEGVVKEHGWSKITVGKMRNLDSFMRESQRVNGITHISVMRKTSQDTTLSDGTFIPAGTIVTGTSTATHKDARNYENPEVFSPLRFAEMRTGEGEDFKHQFGSTSPEYVSFGLGKHACPGRFFAVNELKVMMAYILLHYDIRFEGGQKRPKNLSIWQLVLPMPKNVLFRKRQPQAEVVTA